MQGSSLLPVLRGRTPKDWRTSMYYRYYHDPGDHNTRAHYGVRTRTHKLIYFWKKDQWELFDLVKDPAEMHNLYAAPGQEQLTATLKAELARLKREVKDDDQLATSSCRMASTARSRSFAGSRIAAHRRHRPAGRSAPAGDPGLHEDRAGRPETRVARGHRADHARQRAKLQSDESALL